MKFSSKFWYFISCAHLHIVLICVTVLLLVLLIYFVFILFYSYIFILGTSPIYAAVLSLLTNLVVPD